MYPGQQLASERPYAEPGSRLDRFGQLPIAVEWITPLDRPRHPDGRTVSKWTHSLVASKLLYETMQEICNIPGAGAGGDNTVKLEAREKKWTRRKIDPLACI